MASTGQARFLHYQKMFYGVKLSGKSFKFNQPDLLLSAGGLGSVDGALGQAGGGAAGPRVAAAVAGGGVGVEQLEGGGGAVETAGVGGVGLLLQGRRDLRVWVGPRSKERLQ